MNLVNICLISNITLKPYFQAALQEIAPLYKLDTEIAAIDYYETVSGCWDVLDIKKAADYIVVCLNFERLFPSSVNDILSGYMSRQAYQNRSIKLCEVMGTDGDVLDLFSLSCRAFGRGLEEKMLDYVKKLGIKKFIFSETGKNRELLHLLEAAGKLQQVK